jgi:hypothetical protein
MEEEIPNQITGIKTEICRNADLLALRSYIQNIATSARRRERKLLSTET